MLDCSKVAVKSRVANLGPGDLPEILLISRLQGPVSLEKVVPMDFKALYPLRSLPFPKFAHSRLHQVTTRQSNLCQRLSEIDLKEIRH